MRSPQFVPITTLGSVGSRCQPASAFVRAATATKNEPGLSPSYRVVSYCSAMEVLPLVVVFSLPACTQRSVCRGAASASRLDPLAFSGDKRDRSKALFYAVLNGTSISDPEPVTYSCDPENLRVDCKRDHLRSFVLKLHRCWIGFPHVWRTIFAILRTPTRLVTTLHSLLWPNNSGALVFTECYVANCPPYCSPSLSGSFSFGSVRGCEGQKL